MGNTTTEHVPVRSRLVAALVWAGGYALVLVLLRLFVHHVFATGRTGSILALPCHLVEGSLLALPLFLHRRAALVVLPLLLADLFVTAIALHYEAILGELPGAAVVLTYLGQLEHLGSSLSSGAHPLWFAAEIVVSWAALLGLYLVLVGRIGRLGARGATIWTGAIVLAASLAWTVTVHASPELLGARLRWSTRLPLAVLVSGARERPADPVPQDRGARTYRELQRLMGLEPFASGLPEAPLCGSEPRHARGEPGGRSVILVVLESVGMEELGARTDGQWLLPNLRRIAASGFLARRMYAVGTQTCQALPANLSGQPAQPWEVVFWRKPLPRFQGLPEALGRGGYRTAYFHGAGLSFEQKRAFLRMVGIQVLHELHDDEPEPRYGWGLADEVMFGRTREWIETHRREHPRVPYFMVFATLSGHHPYDLPEDWPRRFAGKTSRERFHETLAYMDHQLGLFYDWYAEHERDRGTYLVLVSDHSPLHDNTEAIASGRPLRFDIPFIVVGPDADEISGWQPYASRLASQLDVPATVGGLVGIHPGPCDQGIDLLGEPWPEGRLIAAVGGRGLDEVHLWDPEVHARLKRRQGSLTVLGSTAEPGEEADRVQRIERFLELFLPASRAIAESGGYAPPAD